MANTSKVITCNREFSDGTVCGRPVAPVFGAWPEECTSCASHILATKDGFEAAERLIEEHYHRLRQQTIAASVPDNPWTNKAMYTKFALLDKFASDIGSRRLMLRMSIARRLDAAKKDTPGRLVNEPLRTALGSMWRNVTPERAIELKQGGFETRFIGVAWQVKIS